MRRFQRGEAPEVLWKRWKEWGMRFTLRRQATSGARFHWPVVGGKSIHQAIVANLKKLAHNHCCYCDGYPLGETSRRTVDHFRPKNRFPRLVCVWANLFLSCEVCQTQKADTFDKKLLKPDQVQYQFLKYFQVNYRTGEILANDQASRSDQERALLTIQTFALNTPERKISRRNTFRRGILSGETLGDVPYRFLFEEACSQGLPGG